MAQYDGSIRINTEINSKNASLQLVGLKNQIEKTADRIASLRSKMESLKDTKIPTQEYTEIQKQIETTEKKINDLLARQEKFLATGGKESSSAFQKMQYDLEELQNSLPYLQSELQDLIDTGKAFTLGKDTQEYADLGQKLSYEQSNLDLLSMKWNEVIAKQKSIPDQFTKMRSAAQKAFTAIFSGAKKAFTAITSGSKRSNASLSSSLKSILIYGLGIRSLYALISKLRSNIEEGLQNFAQYSAEYNKAMSSLKSANTQLKNSFATAFAPIVQTAIPYLVQLNKYITKALNAVSQLMAVLGGKSTWTRAVEVQEDYAGALDATSASAKKAVKALAGFDKLNVLGKNDSDGGGISGINPTDMFEEVPIENKWEDIAQKLKDMWKNSDFYDLSKSIGEWLKNALDGIPWNEIKEKARKLGKSLASLINGFIEVDGLGYSIGRTLAEAFNTGFEFLNAFVHELRWESIGKFIADTLNGVFENIDWELIRDTFVTGFKGLADTINSFVDNFNWDNVSNTISNAINTIAETVYTFFSTVDWEKIGKELGNQLKETIKKIDWEEIGKAIGSVIQAALDFVTSFIGEQDFGEIAQAVVDALKGVFETVDMGELAELIMAALTIKLAATATASLFKTAAVAILNALAGAIATSTSALSNVALSILTGIATAFTSLGGIGGILTTDLATITGAGTAAEIGLTIGAGIISGLIGAFAGGITAEFIDNYLLGPFFSLFDEELGNYYKNFKWLGEGGFFDTIASDWETALLASKDMIVDFENDPVFQGLSDVLIGPWATAAITIPSHTEEIATAFDNFKSLFTDGQFQSAVELWGDDIYSAFVTLGERQSEKFGEIKESISETWNLIKESASEKWSDIKESLSEKWESMKETASDIFNSMKEKVSGIWDGLWSNIKGVINSILGGVESMANGVVEAINTVIGALNSLHFDIPDWIPGSLGGKTFGFNIGEIPAVNIPRLADGAVIRGGDPFMAVLGDQRHGQTNIEAPLATIRQAVREELKLQRNSFKDSGNGSYVFQVDGKTFFEITRSEAQRYFKCTGRSPYPT